MTIQNTADGVGFSCDACGEVWEPPKMGRGSEPRPFEECLQMSRKAGWRSVEVKSKVPHTKVWEHRCPDCV